MRNLDLIDQICWQAGAIEAWNAQRQAGGAERIVLAALRLNEHGGATEFVALRQLPSGVLEMVDCLLRGACAAESEAFWRNALGADFVVNVSQAEVV